jgi:DNA adenine methylase
MAATASPFIKWAGGKKQLLSQLEPLFPPKWGRYHEPFVGGGAVFFHLASRGRCGRARLSDINEELIACYAAVRDSVGKVILALRRHARAHGKQHYYKTRAKDPTALSPASRAARLIYLNKTCFNGLYRVNSKGQFNVPMGSYKNPTICDAANLRAASEALSGADLAVRPFTEAGDLADAGDFLYLDPPYVPVSATSSFTSYARTPFGDMEQRALADLFGRLAGRGCYVMLSNSDAPLVRTLYSEWNIHKVSARRAINSKGEGRGAITELVVTSY